MVILSSGIVKEISVAPSVTGIFLPCVKYTEFTTRNSVNCQPSSGLTVIFTVSPSAATVLSVLIVPPCSALRIATANFSSSTSAAVVVSYAVIR
ncbi:MAG: hypothetical protein IKO99_00020 [Bacteroidales bacterium]|nr:hypothetical protein [Bacteroidales bacterium]